jgi:hypothetical protein
MKVLKYRSLPREAVVVHENEDGLEDLNVYSWRDDEIVWLQQGDDLIGIPVDDLERAMTRIVGAALATGEPA